VEPVLDPLATLGPGGNLMGAGPGGTRVADLDALLSAAPDAMAVIDTHGVIVLLNERCERMLGYARGELVGQPVEVLVPADVRDLHRHHRSRYAADAAVRDMAASLELRACRKDTTQIPVRVSLGPFETEDGEMVLAVLRDLSRSRYDEGLFRRFLEAAPDAVVVVDDEGRIILVNGEVEAMFGYGQAELLGRQVEVLVPERLAGMRDAFRSGYLTRPRHRPVGVAGGLFGRRKDGTEFPVEISLAPVDTEDGVLVLASVRDVSERQQVAAAIREVEEQRRIQEQTNRAKDEFFATVSHELRTPLTSIIGYAELLADLDGDLSPQGREFLSVIDRNARRELKLVDDLLTLVAVEGSGLPVELSRVDLAEIAREAIEEQRPVARSRAISLTLDVPGPAVMIEGDPDRLGQALTNLLSNALKFTPRGGAVRVALGISGDVARIDVADTGMGIGAIDPEHLFERLFRGEQAVAQEIPGAGLGLPIALAIVVAHQGTVRVLETRETGTTFRMEFPLAAASVDARGVPTDHQP
jgi:protein-histidine pros-kinase